VVTVGLRWPLIAAGLLGGRENNNHYNYLRVLGRLACASQVHRSVLFGLRALWLAGMGALSLAHKLHETSLLLKLISAERGAALLFAARGLACARVCARARVQVVVSARFGQSRPLAQDNGGRNHR